MLRQLLNEKIQMDIIRMTAIFFLIFAYLISLTLHSGEKEMPKKNNLLTVFMGYFLLMKFKYYFSQEVS